METRYAAAVTFPICQWRALARTAQSPLRDEGAVGSGESAQGGGLAGERLIVPPCDVPSKMPLPESARYTHAEAGIAEAMVCGILWTRS